jgi:hypothetical protein
MDARVIRMMKRFAITMLVALGSMAFLGLPTSLAQEVQISGPLAGAPAVMDLKVYREGRFSIKLAASMTLQDEYDQAVFVGGELAYHIWDFLGIGVWGGFAPDPFHITTSLTDQIKSKGIPGSRNLLSLPTGAKFPDQIGKINWIVAPQVTFIPLRGKLGIFEELFVDTDFYIFAGVAIIGLTERADASSLAGVCANTPVDQACKNSQTARKSPVTVAPTFGVGLSFFFVDYLSMNLEWRGLPFAWNTSGFDESGSPKGDFPDRKINSDDELFQFNHMISLGFTFYLPLDATITSRGR